MMGVSTDNEMYNWGGSQEGREDMVQIRQLGVVLYMKP